MPSKLLVIPLALGVMGAAAAAHAAPSGLLQAVTQPASEQAADVQQVHYRRHYRYYSYYVRPAPRVFSFYVGPRPYFYGYRRWY